MVLFHEVMHMTYILFVLNGEAEEKREKGISSASTLSLLFPLLHPAHDIIGICGSVCVHDFYI